MEENHPKKETKKVKTNTNNEKCQKSDQKVEAQKQIEKDANNQ